MKNQGLLTLGLAVLSLALTPVLRAADKDVEALAGANR